MTRSPAGATIQLRISGALHTRLEAFRARLEAERRAEAKAAGEDPGAIVISQSACVRALLETALGTPSQTVVAHETMRIVYQKVHAAMLVAREEISRAVLAEFEEG